MKKPHYVPRVRLTFFVYEAATQPFLEVVMPVVFTVFATSANFLYGDSIDEFLASQAALGLTVVLMIPLLSHSKSFSDRFSISHLYILLIFAGFILSTSVFIYNYRRPKRLKGALRPMVNSLVVAFVWSPLVIPMRSMAMHVLLRRVLRSTPHPVASPMSFNGRPGPGGTDLDALRPLYAPNDGKKGPPRPNPAAVHASARPEAEATYAAEVTAPWQFDDDTKAFRTGLARAQALELTHILHRSIGQIFRTWFDTIAHSPSRRRRESFAAAMVSTPTLRRTSSVGSQGG